MHKFTISWSCTILKLKQAIWFSRPDCAPRSECPQFRMPVERCAQFRVPNVPRSRISERAPFWIYEHPNVDSLNVPLCSAPTCMSYLASSKRGRLLCYRHATAHWCLQQSGQYHTCWISYHKPSADFVCRSGKLSLLLFSRLSSNNAMCSFSITSAYRSSSGCQPGSTNQ